MELNDLRPFLERELTYPADVDTVRREVGSAEVSAPDEEDTRTVGELLDDVEEDTYDSVTELVETILSRLPDEYVGRKFYDDRGGVDPQTDEIRRDDEDRSF